MIPKVAVLQRDWEYRCEADLGEILEVVLGGTTPKVDVLQHCWEDRLRLRWVLQVDFANTKTIWQHGWEENWGQMVARNVQMVVMTSGIKQGKFFVAIMFRW